jgi:hypothetical protein
LNGRAKQGKGWGNASVTLPPGPGTDKRACGQMRVLFGPMHFGPNLKPK